MKESEQELISPLSLSDKGTNFASRRKELLNKVRCSLQVIPLLSQNHSLASSRLLSDSNNQEEPDSGEISETKSQFVLSSHTFSDIFEEKYEVLQKLGEGSSGVVYRCAKRSNDQTFAVKVFSFEDEHVPGLKANFLVLKRLKHPYILSYEGLYLDIKKHQGWLVMELAEAPSLAKAHIGREEELKTVMHQLFQALSYLHKQDIVHRDIKPENVLYDPEAKTIKIIDFGISRRCRKRGQLFNMWSNTGTLYYKAPEMFSGSYREGVDVWAAGILLYQLVCGYTPFESQYHSQTIQNITTADIFFPSIFNNYSTSLMSLINSMLTKDPQQRPSFFECLNNIWLYSVNSSIHPNFGSMNHIDDLEDCKQVDEYQIIVGSMKQFESVENEKQQPIPVRQRRQSISHSSIQPFVRKANNDEYHYIDDFQEKESRPKIHKANTLNLY